MAGNPRMMLTSVSRAMSFGKYSRFSNLAGICAPSEPAHVAAKTMISGKRRMTMPGMRLAP